MSVSVLGIDPGLTGALAFIKPSGVFIYDMPVVEYKTTTKKTRREVNVVTLERLLKTYEPDQAFLEAVAGMPKMGGTQMFAFGQSYGMVKAVLTITCSQYHAISPQKWKNHYGLGKDKDQSRALAAEKFPDKEKYFARKKDDGRAEAALIALYGLNEMGLNLNQ